jgi:predicted RNA polymerase sigma factor
VDALTSGSGRRAADPEAGRPEAGGPEAGGPEARGPAARAAGLAARDSYGRLLAFLSASTSDIASAEDALADAFERALRTWPARGVPAHPGAWLLTVARNRLRDHWKSAQAQRTFPLGDDLEAMAYTDDPDAEAIPDVEAIPDRRLELMLVCAHPAIEPVAHTPLMLNTVLGFTAGQVGRAFAVPAPTMATRLVRAKRRIKAARIPFRIPDRSDLPPRMTAVLEAIYGAYVIDWATTGPQARQLPSEALHLAEVLTTLVPGDPEAHGLAALVQLSASRAPARLDAEGTSSRCPSRTRRCGTRG